MPPQDKESDPQVIELAEALQADPRFRHYLETARDGSLMPEQVTATIQNITGALASTFGVGGEGALPSNEHTSDTKEAEKEERDTREAEEELTLAVILENEVDVEEFTVEELELAIRQAIELTLSIA
jgi:hypothetical protein